jgi:hypothetical protein
MTHPPQEVLIKVMCSERYPTSEGYYKTNIGEIYYSVKYVSFINEFGSKLNPSIWYEPATRIVLTEDGYKEMESERLAFKDFVQWMFTHKYSQVENVDIPSETIRFIHNRLGYANP